MRLHHKTYSFIYLSMGCVTHTKNNFENNPLDTYISTVRLMFKHGMAWSHRVMVLGVVCGVFIYLFIYYLFIYL